MTAFGDLWNELTAQVKVLDSLAAQKFVNRAWLDIGKTYEWSWLRARGVFSAPASISTGTVSINQFSRDLTFSAAAAAVLDAVTLDIPLTVRQIKIGGGPPYSIATYTAGGAATLDPNSPAFQETSATSSTYAIVKAYYAPPSVDCARLISVCDPIAGYPLAHGSRWTQEILDQTDPTRGDTSQPLCLATLLTVPTIETTGETSAFSPRYEIWPHPTTARGFQVAYRKRTANFVNDDDTIPDSISPDLVISKAKSLAYEWAEANKASQPELQASNWSALLQLALAEYKANLDREIKHDRELFPNNRVFQREWGMFSPTYLQQHDNPLDYIAALRGYSS